MKKLLVLIMTIAFLAASCKSPNSTSTGNGNGGDGNTIDRPTRENAIDNGLIVIDTGDGLIDRPLPGGNNVVDRPLPGGNNVVDRPLPSVDEGAKDGLIDRPLPGGNNVVDRPLPGGNNVVDRPMRPEDNGQGGGITDPANPLPDFSLKPGEKIIFDIAKITAMGWGHEFTPVDKTIIKVEQGIAGSSLAGYDGVKPNTTYWVLTAIKAGKTEVTHSYNQNNPAKYVEDVFTIKVQ